MKVCSRCGHIYDDGFDACPQCSKREKVCKKCGRENEPDAQFCIFCGEKFPQKKICDCGAKNPEDAEYCYACGRTLDEAFVLPEIKHIPGWKIAIACIAAFLVLAAISYII